jgi:uroporphyrinogen decarboxylase
MTSRELVRRAILFDRPPRVPRQAWVTPWAVARYPAEVARLHRQFPDDIVTAPAAYRRRPVTQGAPYRQGRYVDEWGCRFDNVHDHLLGLVREPLIRAWDDLEWFSTPDVVLDIDVEAVNNFCRETDRFVIAGTLIRPFERLGFLRTAEQALMDVAEQTSAFRELLRRIHMHYLREVEAWARTDVDAIEIMDDWGMQTRMLVHPRLFRAHFKPLYAEYAAVARQYGKAVFMHADGQVIDIVEDLIDCGVQALNSQVACMGLGELGRRFRGRLTFWGEFDRQAVLADGTPASVDAAVREFRDHLAAEGGVIAQCEFGPGAQPANVLQVFASFAALDGASA